MWAPGSSRDQASLHLAKGVSLQCLFDGPSMREVPKGGWP
jgi:hypothetical protein